MVAEDIIAAVDRIFIQEFELDSELVTPSARLQEDLDLDSLDAVDMIVLLEQHFGVHVDDKEVAEMVTVGDIHAYVGRLVAQQAAAGDATDAAAPKDGADAAHP